MSLVRFRPEAPFRGFSSFGRAPPCQGGGGGFEPRNPLQKRVRKSRFSYPIFNKIRRHSQAVRQRSAKPSSPVRFRVAPPAEKPTHRVGFSVGGATLLSIALVAQGAANRFAFAARRSASSLARRRASEFSPEVKFRVYSKRKADPSGRLFCWRRHPFIDRARRARRGEPVRIRRPEICKLACKAKGERIFTKGEIPGSDFENRNFIPCIERIFHPVFRLLVDRTDVLWYTEQERPRYRDREEIMKKKQL